MIPDNRQAPEELPTPMPEPEPEPRNVEADARARRRYLIGRRRELLAPAHTLRDILSELHADEIISSVNFIIDDLTTVRDAVEQLIEMFDQALHPDRADGDEAPHILNHHARNQLAIVIGYAEELRRGATEAFLDDYFADFDQVGVLGNHALTLLDATVARLRSPDCAPTADDARGPIGRDQSGGETAGDADLPSAEPGLILVAEDHDKIRDLLCGLLERQGHEVVPARDGREALALIGSRPFDLILTDIEMPLVDGFEVLEYLKKDENLREIPVIVVSGHGEIHNICRCIKSGAEDYLPKPYNRVILKARVDACLEKKRLRGRNEQQRRRYDQLLKSILPAQIVQELSETNAFPPRRRERVAVLFADIVGFTRFCNRRQDQPEVIVRCLQKAFEAWEEVASNLGVLKIKTIGDAFMATSGLLVDAEDPVMDCVRCGLQMIETTRALLDDEGKEIGWDLRVGIHVGPVVTGVLGRRQSLLDLWGDTVNIAARLESQGEPGHVNLGVESWGAVAGRIRNEARSMRKLRGTEVEREVIHLNPGTVEILPDGRPGPA